MEERRDGANILNVEVAVSLQGSFCKVESPPPVVSTISQVMISFHVSMSPKSFSRSCLKDSREFRVRNLLK